MLTDFQNSFTDRLSGKFAIKSWWNIPPHHRCARSVTNQCFIYINGCHQHISPSPTYAGRDIWQVNSPWIPPGSVNWVPALAAVKKVQFSHIHYQALVPELILVYRQSACRWLFKSSPAVGCHYFSSDLWSPSQPKNVTVLRPVPFILLGDRGT